MSVAGSGRLCELRLALRRDRGEAEAGEEGEEVCRAGAAVRPSVRLQVAAI